MTKNLHDRATDVAGRQDRILVVDDSQHNRMVATGYLAAAGYEMAVAVTGEEALAYLEREEVDLVLLDVLMPGINGFETCKRIRAGKRNARVPVLFLTALGDRETTAPALEAGGDDLLSKPFDRAELLLRVRALIRLRRQEQQLAAQNEQLRKLSAMIVHDLRGPACAILANAELLYEAKLGGELGEAVDDISIAINHLNRTVCDLLDLARSDDVAMRAERGTCDLEMLANEIAATYRGHARLRAVAIRPEIREPAVVADRQLVRRVLENLVQNAIRHSPHGGEVVIEATGDGDAVELRVLDRGPGVPEKDRERIFDRYVSNGSYGLGLAFCRLAVAAHGGSIRVEDRAGGGSAFVVRLPR